MLDTFPAALVFALLVALALAAVYALTVVPLVLALGMAERRGFPGGRWALVAGAGVLLALVAAALLHRRDAPLVAQVLALGLAFAGPGALWLLEPGQRLGGRGGRHESAL